MLNKKGFVITPIIFIVFFIIAIVFSFYVSDIDQEISYGIQKTSAIEKANHDIQKEQINQINFVKIATYACSENYSYPCNKTSLENCVDDKLDQLDENWNWDYSVLSNSSFKFDIPKINATNINMSSDSITINGEFSSEFLNTNC